MSALEFKTSQVKLLTVGLIAEIQCESRRVLRERVVVFSFPQVNYFFLHIHAQKNNEN